MVRLLRVVKVAEIESGRGMPKMSKESSGSISINLKSFFLFLIRRDPGQIGLTRQ